MMQPPLPRCPNCGLPQAVPVAACPGCGHSFIATGVTTGIAPPQGARVGAQDMTAVATPITGITHAATTPSGEGTGPLAVGQAFGARYHIIRRLGAGGMGVVYQAWDTELNVAVALKVIRPDAVSDPQTAAEVERRFKRELVLARQVTHANVVRIHDLGERDGIKYLTMPFVEGRDLASVLKQRGTLPVDEALAIARQIAQGLAAAHRVGVVHRDLKPENVMLSTDGTALIMDFGISRSMSGTATATALGTVIGTLEYMAPEQAQGLAVDPRADIYSFGLILYDMLCGRQRIARRDNPMSEMMSRMQQPPPSLRELDAQLPEALDRIVSRCLEPAPDKRYQTTDELVAALDGLTADGHAIVTPRAKTSSLAMPVAFAAIAVLAIAVAGWAIWRGRAPAGTAAAPTRPVSVLIANFENPSGDPLLDGLVEQALAVGVEGSSFISAYPRRDAVRAAERIRQGAALDESTARLVAISEGIDRVLAGSITPAGDGYRLTVKVVDPSAGKVLLTWETDASGKGDVLNAVGRAAAKVRSSFGDQKADPSRVSNAETFTAASLEAAHAYVQAQDFQWAGQYEQALAQYKEAVRLDPQLGRAYAGMGAVSNSLGRRDEAEQYYKRALELTSRMTEREKYRTRSGYYLLTHDWRKAQDELEALTKTFPADQAGLTNLAFVKFLERDMAGAKAMGKKVADLYPRNVLGRNNYALYAMYSGDFATAQSEAAAVLQLNPSFAKAYVATAVSQLATGDSAKAADTYARLQRVSATGADFASLGLADLAMYEGRLADAARVLTGAIAAPPAGRSATTQARLKVTLAELQAMQQKDADAARAAEEALTTASNNSGIAFLAARALLAAGRAPRTLEIAGLLDAKFDEEPRMYAKLLDGEVALAQGRTTDALARVQEAQAIADSWIGRFDLGRIYLAAGKFAEADSEFDRCLKRRGEVTAGLLDDVPTYRWFPPVYYYSGLAKQGLNADGSDAFKTFLRIKQKGDEAGIVADARRR